YKNRKRTKWAKHTRTVIFFTRILARVRLNQDTKSVKIRTKIRNQTQYPRYKCDLASHSLLRLVLV
ncbi:hypothetical protein, partial [Streptococcus ruminantium]